MTRKYDCETCHDDPVVCADIPMRHCEKLQRTAEAEREVERRAINDYNHSVGRSPLKN